MKTFKKLVQNRIEEFAKKFESSAKFRKELVEEYNLHEIYGDESSLKGLWVYCGPSEWDTPSLICMYKNEELKWNTVEFNDIVLLTNYLKKYFRDEFPGLKLTAAEWQYLHAAANTADIKSHNRKINYERSF